MNYSVVLIEIITSLLALILLVMELVLPGERKRGVGYFSALALTIILVAFCTDAGKTGAFFNGFYVSDALSIFFKQVFLIAAILATLMSLGYEKRLQDGKNEFFALNVFALLGMMIMASANDLITLYVGLELMTLSFVILTAYDKNSLKSSEAGVKYILLNAMSSGILLYGMSIIYGLSRSPAFNEIIKYLQNGTKDPLLVLAVIMLIAGFGFKISAVPFHMWSPDIYEGAPTPVTAFLVMGSKAAGFAVLTRIFIQVLPASGSTFISLIVALAALSIVVGNLIAIPQRNIKRMLAYSSIAHAGYILLGIIAATKMGISAMLYYILLYIFANAGAFAAVIAISNQAGSEEIKDFEGMWKRSPFISAVLMLSLLSLAGIPPAAGFIGKFYLFMEIIKQGYLWLAFLAFGMSVVSVYFYIVVIRTLLSGGKVDDTPVFVPLSLKIVMIVSAAMTLVMGIIPGPVTDWIVRIASLI